MSFDKGVTIPAWFDVNSFDKSAHLDKIDEKGMLESVDTGNIHPCLYFVLYIYSFIPSSQPACSKRNR